MKQPFQFQFEWEDPLGARGPELRATWARLEIRVDDIPVSRLIDEKNRSIRDAVYGPLYPVAEWIAMNWWSLLHEVEVPGTPRWETYAMEFEEREYLSGIATQVPAEVLGEFVSATDFCHLEDALKNLELNGTLVATDRNLAEALDADEGGLFRNVLNLGTSQWDIDALVVPASNENPDILSTKAEG